MKEKGILFIILLNCDIISPKFQIQFKIPLLFKNMTNQHEYVMRILKILQKTVMTKGKFFDTATKGLSFDICPVK